MEVKPGLTDRGKPSRGQATTRAARSPWNFQQEIEEVTPEQEIITGKELGVGIYILKIQQGSQVQNIRIVKQR